MILGFIYLKDKFVLNINKYICQNHGRRTKTLFFIVIEGF